MAGMTSWAVVKFEEDGLCYATHVSNIDGFSPKFSLDFVPNAYLYPVKWEKSFHDADKHHSGRYMAEILVLGVSEQEVKLKFKEKFPKLKKVHGTIPNFLSANKKPQEVSHDKKRRRHNGLAKNTEVVKPILMKEGNSVEAQTSEAPTKPAAKEVGGPKSQESDRRKESSSSKKISSSSGKNTKVIKPILMKEGNSVDAQTSEAPTKPAAKEVGDPKSQESDRRKESSSSMKSSYSSGKAARTPLSNKPTDHGTTKPHLPAKIVSPKNTSTQGDVTKTAEYQELARQNSLLLLQMEKMKKQGSTTQAREPRRTEANATALQVGEVDRSVSQISTPPLSPNSLQGGIYDDIYVSEGENADEGKDKDADDKDQGDDICVENDDSTNVTVELQTDSDDEATINRIYDDLTGDVLLQPEEPDGKKVYIGKKCSMKSKYYSFRVRTAKSDSKFVKAMAQGLWGKKKCMKRTLTGTSRSAISKQKATPRKVDCLFAAFKGYMKYKRVPEEAQKDKLVTARRRLIEKFGDAGRDNDPDYREKTKARNAAARARKRAAREVDEPSSSSSTDGED